LKKNKKTEKRRNTLQGPSCVAINDKLYTHDVSMTMVSTTTNNNHLRRSFFFRESPPFLFYM